MNRDFLVKALKSAAAVVLPGAFISLLVCTLMLGSDIFEMLMPVWLVIIFAVISFVLSRVPFISRRLWARLVISAAAVAAAVILLRIF